MTGGRPLTAIAMVACLLLASCSSEPGAQKHDDRAPGSVQAASMNAMAADGPDALPANAGERKLVQPQPPRSDLTGNATDRDVGVLGSSPAPTSNMTIANQSGGVSANGNQTPPIPHSMAAAPDLPATEGLAGTVPFPREVTEYMVRRDGCDHFRGEEPYDEARRVFLNANIRALCTGADAKLEQLRQKYAGNAEVIAALAGYSARIEP